MFMCSSECKLEVFKVFLSCLKGNLLKKELLKVKRYGGLEYSFIEVTKNGVSYKGGNGSVSIKMGYSFGESKVEISLVEYSSEGKESISNYSIQMPKATRLKKLSFESFDYREIMLVDYKDWSLISDPLCA